MLKRLCFYKQLFVFVAVLFVTSCQQAPQTWQTSDITGAIPDLSFSLNETSGNKPVTADNYRGKVTLLFFGFTHCPQVCPTTLLQLQQATTKLAELGEQTQVLFVSVDPDRDDMTTIQRYVENFGSRTVGLRGVEQQLKALTQRYFITYDKEEMPANGNYDMMHSSQVYVFDKKGQARLLFRASDSVAAMKADLRRLISEFNG